MSERILKALMQLFAIVADVEDISKNSRKIVASFLKEQLNRELVEEYLKLFDQFLEEQSRKKDGTKKKKRTSVNSVKVLLICTQINEELTQKQKIVVLLRLLEYIYADEEVTEQELEFVTTVSETFNISQEEFQRCQEFTKSGQEEIPESPALLIVDNTPKSKYKECKHIFAEGLKGHMRVLWVESVNMFALRYYGVSELTLNGQLINPNTTYILTQGSSIRSSRVQPIYYSDIITSFLSDETSEKIVFNTDELTYRFKSGDVGMHPLNFSEESGRLIGIMGASGAGKSTLLNLLNGNYTPTTGSVSINGVDIHHEGNKIEGVIGYVSQDDLLIEELTVFQNLFYNAKLCFDNYSEQQLVKLVLEVLTSIGLYEAKDLKVGSPLDKTISGGQRKRLNIALELIREPSVLFVDEPTSGLSSRDSENIMDLLKELALKGKLVFVVIHQPSSDIFKMFDRLIILDTGGFPIYNGNPVDAVIYFKEQVNHVNAQESECPTCGNVNPEQIFNIIEAKVVDEFGNTTPNRKISPKQWYKFYLDNIEVNENEGDTPDDVPKSSFNIPNKLKQFKVFMTRDVLSKLTNKQYLSINLLEAPVLAFILAYIVRYFNTDASNDIGYIYRENENIPAYIFMAVIVALFIGLTVSAEEIIRDQKIRKREQFLNLSKSSYIISKIVIMFMLSAIQTLTFVLIGNAILGIQGMYVDYWIILFSTACFANMLGLNISASFNSAVTIYILIPFLIIPQLLLSGVIVKFDKLNPAITSQKKVPIVGELMTSRWAFEALAVNQFKNNDFEQHFYKFDKTLKNAEYKKNFWIGKIREVISRVSNNMGKDGDKEKLKKDLELLRSEIREELKENTEVEFDQADQLFADKVNEKALQGVKSYLDRLNDHYIDEYNTANEKKDKVVVEMNNTPEKKEDFIKLKNNYTNDAVSDMVTNKNEFNKIIEKDGELIRRLGPVYEEPEGFRTHFYAPSKLLFGKYISTFWANTLVIWLMCVILMFTLYYDVLRKFIEGLENWMDRLKNIRSKK